MILSDVTPGQRVRVPGTGLTASLVEINRGSATVLVSRHVDRSFTTSDGRQVRFSTEREQTTWSLSTNVERVTEKL